MHRFKAVTLLMTFAVAFWSGAKATHADEAAWARTPKIAAFDGRFGYEAYADRVVVIENATGNREAIRAGGRSAVGASFSDFLTGNAEIAGKLGAALSPETKAFGDKISVQVFQNGAIIYEPASRTRWWSWHSQARSVIAGSTPSPPTTSKPGVFSAVIVDETGAASPAERQAIAKALRDFKVRHGITIGVVFLKPMSLEAAQTKAKNYRQQLLEKKYLPENSAVFTLRDDASYIWQSDARVRGQISFDQVKQAWNKTSNSSNYAQLTQEFLRELSQMIGGQAPIKTPVKPPVNEPPVTTTSIKTTPINNAPASTLGGSTPPAVQAGEVVAQKRIGPAGGSVSASGITVEFPPGALKVEENVALRRTKATSPDAQFVYVDRDGGSTLLARPAKVRFKMPSNVPAADVVATQQITNAMWIVAPSTYDAKTRTLEMDVLHFSGTGWFNTRNCVRMVGGAITVVGTTLVWYAGAAVGVVVAVPAAMTVGATAVVLGTGAVGAAIFDKGYDEYQRMGFDGVLMLSGLEGKTDWVVRWKSSDFVGEKNVITLALDRQGRMVAAVPDKFDKNEFFAAMYKDKSKQQIDSFRTVPRSIFEMAQRLIQTKEYYRSNKYNPPGAVEVLMDSNLAKAKTGEKHLGEWDQKFLHLDVKLVRNLVSDTGTVDLAKDAEITATLMHEYWHVIYFANGYGRTSKYSWLDEGMATALESEVVVSNAEPFDNKHKALYVAGQLERGLSNIDDPYSTWPLGKYFLHKKGGDYVTQIALGKVDETKWTGANGLFADFVRSLLITEHALPNFVGSSPTGWGEIDVSAWGALRGLGKALYLGDNGLILVLDGMSYSLRFARVALPVGEAPSPLIIRREKPNNTELFIALKPDVGAVIGQRRPKNAASEGLGGVALPASWVAQSMSTVPFGIAHITTGRGNSGSPLYVYRLRPPSRVTSTPTAAGVTLRWKMPDMGENLRAADALNGYRAFYKNKDGKTVILPDFLIKPETEAVTILASAMPGFTAVGLASEDKFVRDSQQKLLISFIAWPEATQTGTVIVLVHGPEPPKSSPNNEWMRGRPIAKTPVTCDYVYDGKAVHLAGETDETGGCEFPNLPLDVEITIGAQGKTKKILCTAKNFDFNVTVKFGWWGPTISFPPPRKY